MERDRPALTGPVIARRRSAFRAGQGEEPFVEFATEARGASVPYSMKVIYTSSGSAGDEKPTRNAAGHVVVLDHEAGAVEVIEKQSGSFPTITRPHQSSTAAAMAS